MKRLVAGVLLMGCLSGTAWAESLPGKSDDAVFENFRGLGETALASENLSAAIAAFQKALARKDDFYVHMQLAKAHAWSGDFETAILAYRKLLARAQSRDWVLYQLGEVLGWAGRYVEAATVYQELEKIDPGNIGAVIGRAYLEIYQGNALTAELALQSLIQGNSQATGAYLALADCRRWQGRWREAEEIFKQVLRVDPALKVARTRCQETQEFLNPLIQSSYIRFENTDFFNQASFENTVRWAAADRFWLQIGYARHLFEQVRALNLVRDEYALELNYIFNLKTTSRFRYVFSRAYETEDSRQHHVFAALDYQPLYQSKINLYFEQRTALESISTVRDGLKTAGGGAGIDWFWAERVSLQGGLAYAAYSDGNFRQEREVQATYQGLNRPLLQLKLYYNYLDYSRHFDARFSPPAEPAVNYWTPSDYEKSGVKLFWRQEIFPAWNYSLEMKAERYGVDSTWGYGITTTMEYRPWPALEIFGKFFYYRAEKEVPWMGNLIQTGIRIRPEYWWNHQQKE